MKIRHSRLLKMMTVSLTLTRTIQTIYLRLRHHRTTKNEGPTVKKRHGLTTRLRIDIIPAADQKHRVSEATHQQPSSLPSLAMTGKNGIVMRPNSPGIGRAPSRGTPQPPMPARSLAPNQSQ